jgi:hypothetical protein
MKVALGIGKDEGIWILGLSLISGQENEYESHTLRFDMGDIGGGGGDYCRLSSSNSAAR